MRTFANFDIDNSNLDWIVFLENLIWCGNRPLFPYAGEVEMGMLGVLLLVKST